MSSRRRWFILPAVAVAGCIAVVLARRSSESKGRISVEFDGWRLLSAPSQMVLIVHNGTEHPVTVTEVICSGNRGFVPQVVRIGTGTFSSTSPASIRLSGADGGPLRSIAPGAKSEVYVDGFPSFGTAEVYFTPWTSEKAKAAAARAAERPKWLARWLRPPQPTKVAVKVEQARGLSF